MRSDSDYVNDQIRPEDDGLLNVDDAATGALGFHADRYARLHPAIPEDVRDFHALTEALSSCAKRMDKLRELMRVSGGRESEIKILDTAEAWSVLAAAKE